MKNKLKVLRAERNWSQADLAERLNVSRQTVNAIETGKYDPSLPLAFKIAELFAKQRSKRYLPRRMENNTTESNQPPVRVHRGWFF